MNISEELAVSTLGVGNYSAWHAGNIIFTFHHNILYKAGLYVYKGIPWRALLYISFLVNQ
jgi:hypothetical protein